MRLYFEAETEAEAAGDAIKGQLDAGTPYVVAGGLGFAELSLEASMRYARSAASRLGPLTLTNANVESDVWLLDSRTSPSAQAIPFHTDNSFVQNPERLVAFWNIKSSSQGGENVLLPVDGLLRWADDNPEATKIIDEATSEPVTFWQADRRARGLMIDPETRTARFDMKYIDPDDQARAARLAGLFSEYGATLPGIKLQPGDALVFDNHRQLHARLPYSDAHRISLRTRTQELA